MSQLSLSASILVIQAAQAILKQAGPGNLNLATRAMESFEASGAAKRRRLTCPAMPADGVKTTKEQRSAELEVGLQKPEKGETKMQMSDLWMQLKRQTEDMENHIRHLAGCDRQESVTAKEPSFENKEVADSVKVTNETGDEQEMMLSSAGGSHAMQGLEVFESAGVPVEEARDEAPVAMPAAEHPALLAVEQKAPQVRKYQLAKQSGVPNIQWCTWSFAWRVHFPKVDSKGKILSWTNRVFAVKKFMAPGCTEAEADAAALEAAKAFHAELVEKGILRDPRLEDPNLISEVPGVCWRKGPKKWVVRVYPNKTKPIYGGHFTEKAAAEAKAVELREKHGLQLQVKPVPTLANRYAGLPVFHPKVPCPGVRWSVQVQEWHAQCCVGGAKTHFKVKPKDHSEAELERSFKVAVAWKKKQEKEKQGKALKSKAKPPKK